MPFGVYEAGTDSATFIRVSVEDDYETADETSIERQKQRIERGKHPFLEQRIVAADNETMLPLAATHEELKELIHSNKAQYPNH